MPIVIISNLCLIKFKSFSILDFTTVEKKGSLISCYLFFIKILLQCVTSSCSILSGISIFLLFVIRDMFPFVLDFIQCDRLYDNLMLLGENQHFVGCLWCFGCLIYTLLFFIKLGRTLSNEFKVIINIINIEVPVA